MREKFIVALLSVCCTLLVVNVIALWSAPTQTAHGQVASGEFIMDTAATQNQAIAFILSPGTKHLAAYSTTGNGGVKVAGVRLIGHDFKYEELKKHQSVAQSKKGGKRK